MASKDDIAGPSPLVRVLSLALLGSILVVGGYLGLAVYHIATDSFVTPIVMSPDSDVVLQGKLAVSRLVAARMRVVAQQDRLKTDLAAADAALDRLKAMRATAMRALDWAKDLTTRHAEAGTGDLRALDHQRDVLAEMIERQRKTVEETSQHVRAGLAVQSDLQREVQTLDQLRVASLENERVRLTTRETVRDATFARQSLLGHGARAPTPEMLVQQDQLLRIDLEVVKLEAERRAKQTEYAHLDEELAKTEELLAELRKRPLYRAMDAPTNVAFVPYTQMSGVDGGAPVYDCVWGLFACKRVGQVMEVLSGEVMVPDPWGTPTRGQYAIMDLDEARAAQSRFLRVRPGRPHSDATATASSATAPVPAGP